MASANNDGSDADEQLTPNGYRDEFDVPDYVPADYDGPVAREDSRGEVRRLCLVETNGTGKPCSNYMDTCRFHDHTLGELKPADERPDNGAPLKLVSDDKNERKAIEGAKDGLRIRDIAALLSTTQPTLSNAINRGKAVHDIPDSELSDKEIRFKSFFNRFKRAWGVGTERLVQGALYDDDIDTQAATFMLERSRDFIKTERREVDANITNDRDDDEGYEILNAEGGRVHPDRSQEARRKRNQKAQREKQAESDDENAPIPVKSQTINSSESVDGGRTADNSAPRAGGRGANDVNQTDSTSVDAQPDDASGANSRANDAKPTPEEREQREASDRNDPPSGNQPLTGRVPDGYECDDGAEK
jgi:hypothetical protein